MKKKTGSIFDDALANNRARLDEMLKPMQIDAPDETQSAGHAPPDAPPVAPRPDTSPRSMAPNRPAVPAPAPVEQDQRPENEPITAQAGGLKFSFRPG